MLQRSPGHRIMARVLSSLLTVAKYFPYKLQSIKKNPKSRVSKPKMKLRKQIIGQKIRKHKDSRFVKRKKEKSHLEAISRKGREERTDAERTLVLGITDCESSVYGPLWKKYRDKRPDHEGFPDRKV